jgi:hypothetical protein
MDGDTPARVPPQVIRVPSPQHPAGVLLRALKLLRSWWLRRHRPDAATREEAAAAPRQVSQDAAAAALADRWPWWHDPPKLPAIRAALELLPAETADRARVVCLGDLDVPYVGDLRFEPEILSPTRLLWRRLTGSALVFAAAAAWIALARLHWLPEPKSTVGFLAVVSVPTVAVWVWKAGIRARYVRLAPGIVQVLEYKWSWTALPAIRSYPMTAGTLAVVHRKREGFEITLARDARQDVISLASLRKGDAAMERVWHALLSTAPTPPLSETELVG